MVFQRPKEISNGRTHGSRTPKKTQRYLLALCSNLLGSVGIRSHSNFGWTPGNESIFPENQPGTFWDEEILGVIRDRFLVKPIFREKFRKLNIFLQEKKYNENKYLERFNNYKIWIFFLITILIFFLFYFSIFFFDCKCTSRYGHFSFIHIKAFENTPELCVFFTFSLANVLRTTWACNFSTT